MGILDRAKAFARVGAGKAGRAAGDAGVKAARLAADGASKGAAALNDAAGKLRDEATSPDAPAQRPESDGTTR